MAELGPASGNRLRIWASGLNAADTGVGVFQREVYARLARRFQLRLGPAQKRSQVGLFPAEALTTVRLTITDLIHQFLGVPRGQVAFVTSSPAPALLAIPTVGVVYDLRWQRTRNRLARTYRKADLGHLVRRSSILVAISERTRADLLNCFPQAESKTEVISLGPGNIDIGSFSNGDPGTLLLVGKARYKRNELAALALSRARPSWARRFVGLSVSDEVRRILENSFGPENCEWHGHLDVAAVDALYARAATFMNLSLDEGFGIPFIEAMSAGCQVIAVRQPLTEALLGDDAILISDGSEHQIAEQLQGLANRQWPIESRRRTRASGYSWDATAAALEMLLIRAAGEAVETA